MSNVAIGLKSIDLGYTANALSHPAAAGTYDLVTLHVRNAADLAAGEYSFRLHPESTLTDANFEEAALDTAPGSEIYTVMVEALPGPTSLVLAPASAVFLRRRRR